MRNVVAFHNKKLLGLFDYIKDCDLPKKGNTFTYISNASFKYQNGWFVYRQKDSFHKIPVKFIPKEYLAMVLLLT